MVKRKVPTSVLSRGTSRPIQNHKINGSDDVQARKFSSIKTAPPPPNLRGVSGTGGVGKAVGRSGGGATQMRQEQASGAGASRKRTWWDTAKTVANVGTIGAIGLATGLAAPAIGAVVGGLAWNGFKWVAQKVVQGAAEAAVGGLLLPGAIIQGAAAAAGAIPVPAPGGIPGGFPE